MAPILARVYAFIPHGATPLQNTLYGPQHIILLTISCVYVVHDSLTPALSTALLQEAAKGRNKITLETRQAETYRIYKAQSAAWTRAGSIGIYGTSESQEPSSQHIVAVSTW